MLTRQGTINLLAILLVAAVIAVAVWMKTDPGSGAKGSGEADAEESATISMRLPRLVDLGATKCRACLDLAPILEALREEYEGRLDVQFVDVWKNPAEGEKYTFRLIPTQILFDREGKEVWRHEGFISKADLETVFAEKTGVE